MKQQINLYVKQEKIQIPFSASISVTIVLLATLLIGSLTGYSLYRRAGVEQEVATLNAALAKQRNAIKQSQLDHIPPAVSPALKSQVEALTASLSGRQAYLALLQKLEPVHSVRFSALLEGLAAQVPEGLWLTRIEALQGGRALQLEGQTLKADLLPRYIRQLGAQPVYQRAEFDRLQMRAAERGLLFTIRARLAGDAAL